MSPHSTSGNFVGGLPPLFMPMNLVAFETPSAQFRTDGAGLTNCMRNIGSAIGVFITTTMLANSVQTIHAPLAQYAAPFNRALGVNSESMFMNLMIPFGMSGLNDPMEYRAQVRAYANDFLFIFCISLPVFFAIWLMKRPSFAANATVPNVEVMDHQ